MPGPVGLRKAGQCGSGYSSGATPVSSHTHTHTHTRTHEHTTVRRVSAVSIESRADPAVAGSERRRGAKKTPRHRAARSGGGDSAGGGGEGGGMARRAATGGERHFKVSSGLPSQFWNCQSRLVSEAPWKLAGRGGGQ